MTARFTFNSRVCVLTGATGGIGRQLAHLLAAEHARLILCGRQEDALETLKAELPDKSVVGLCAGSLDDAVILDRLVAYGMEKQCSVLINLLGINQLADFTDMDGQAVNQLVRTNLVTPMQLTRRLLPVLTRQPTAMVTNVGSVFGHIGHPGYVAYCATKFGLRGFSEALRREVADTCVSVVHVEPRATKTAMNDGPARALNDALGNHEDEPAEVAGEILTAMRRRRPMTVLGWPERFFVSLNQILPGVVDKALRGKLAIVRRHLVARPAQTTSAPNRNR